MQKGYRQPYPPLPAGELVTAAVNNNYLAGEAGVELRREMKNMNGSLRVGYKRVLAGEGPELVYAMEYPGGVSYQSYSNDMDKDYLHVTLGGTLKLKQNLSLTAEGGWLEGRHDRELMADVKLNWAF